jgi:hypothetical protein
MQGEEVPMMFTMCRFQCKFPTALGWPEGPIPASLVLTELERHVPSEAVAEIQPRHNDTATCLIHSDFTDTLLRASGKHSVFYKEVSPAQEYLLLWLDDAMSLQDAVKLAEHQDAFGVVRKGHAASPKFAIRFRDVNCLKEFAANQPIIPFWMFLISGDGKSMALTIRSAPMVYWHGSRSVVFKKWKFSTWTMVLAFG